VGGLSEGMESSIGRMLVVGLKCEKMRMHVEATLLRMLARIVAIVAAAAAAAGGWFVDASDLSPPQGHHEPLFQLIFIV